MACIIHSYWDMDCRKFLWLKNFYVNENGIGRLRLCVFKAVEHTNVLIIREGESFRMTEHHERASNFDLRQARG